MMLQQKIHNVLYALRGIRIAWEEEFSFRVEVVAASIVFLLGWYYAISSIEWLVIITTIGIVFAAEIFNTALEELCDMYKSDPDPHIAKIKNLAAAAVLVSSMTAFAVGIIIFLPKCLAFFS